MKSFFAEKEKILIYRARDYKRPNKNDKKSYLILSTFHANCRQVVLNKSNQVKKCTVSTEKNRRQTSTTMGPMMIPAATKYYNKNKDPVDRSDAKGNTEALHKISKWYRRAADELIFNTSVVNAFELYRSTIQNFDSRRTTVPKETIKLYSDLLREGKKESKFYNLYKTIKKIVYC